MDGDIDDDYYKLNYDVKPITALERSFQEYQDDAAVAEAAKEQYKDIIKKPRVTYDSISKVRSKRKNALRKLLTSAQKLHTRAAADNVSFYRDQAMRSMIESDNILWKLNTAGLRRKRNKSRNKVYSARKKSKRRRVKSTRRRHKKTTRHHRNKY